MPAGVSTLKILLLASKRWPRLVSPKVTSVSAAMATCPAFLTTTSVVIFGLEEDAAEVGEDLSEVGVKARGGGAVDHAVVPAQRQRQHQARLEGLAVPDRLGRALADAQDGHFRRVD